MHYNEWIKKYSPKNQILKFSELAMMMGKAPSLLYYYFHTKGCLMADSKKPRLIGGE
jgi:hypothetical protein